MCGRRRSSSISIPRAKAKEFKVKPNPEMSRMISRNVLSASGTTTNAKAITSTLYITTKRCKWVYMYFIAKRYGMARYLSPGVQQVLEVFEPMLLYKKSSDQQKRW